MNLHSLFTSVAYKRLVLVDLPAKGSNQHEINGVSDLKRFFAISEGKVSGPINWHYFVDNSDPVHSTGQYAFYDARARSAARTGRSEWRMYYTGDFLGYASPRDTLILAKTADQRVFGLVFQKDSGWLRAARVLFGVESIQPRFQLLREEDLSEQELEFSEQQILDELEIQVELPTSIQDEDLAAKELELARKEGRDFPSTQRMSDLARSLVDVNIANADEALVRWLDREEAVFRAIEKILVQRKINEGFESVDEFIRYSLSIQNRRKSRMGYALQHHLAQLFNSHGLRFETQKTTEGKNKPDFLFPGQAEYRSPNFNANRLVMLGAKSSCKDRWRQILTEANRIKNKHLCTLEQAISTDQTEEMKTQMVTLVLPSKLHRSYTAQQRKETWTANQFIEFVRAKQSH